MRKTIIITAAAALLAVTGVCAEESANSELTTTMELEVPKVNSFCKAIMQGDYDTVKRMIELGEDVNKKSLGMSPVIFAARYNKAEILELLIDSGADLSQKCDKGYTAKKHAEISGADAALSVIEDAMKS